VITPPLLLEMDGEAEEQQSKMKTKRMAQQSSPGNLVRAIFAAGTNAGGGPILVLILLPIVSLSRSLFCLSVVRLSAEDAPAFLLCLNSSRPFHIYLFVFAPLSLSILLCTHQPLRMTIDSGFGWSTTQQYVAFSRTELVPHDNICFCSTKSRFDRSELIDFITLFAGHARRLIYFSLPIGFDFFLLYKCTSKPIK
jgi:hypothetical protein